MKTIRIIDLLNKIANGEDTPKEIKYDGYTFKKANESYIEEDGDNLTDHICYDYSNLNDEVEIIEEEIKPLTKQDVEALGYACGEIQKCFTNGWNKSLKNKPFKEDKKIEKLKENESIENDTGTCLRNLTNKINEIIDYLMESKK